MLTGFTLVTILLTVGLSTQSFAMPMKENSQDKVLAKAMAGNLGSHGQEYVLVSIPPTHKGEHAIYQLVPKPIEGPDGIAILTPTDSSQMILISMPPTHKGEHATYQLVPKPAPDPHDFTS